MSKRPMQYAQGERPHFTYPVLPHEHISAKFATLGIENSAKLYRLGIFGGTFDPVHNGHLALAKAALGELNLAGVLFIPASIQPFKVDEEHASAENRYRMLYKATEDEPYFDVSTIEIDRGGVSYSVDTLRELREYFPPNVELVFLLGSDAFEGLPRWYKPCEIAALATIGIACRPGYEDSFGKEFLESQKDILSQFTCEFFVAPQIDISSRELRAANSRGDSLAEATPAKVASYIERARLYEKFPHVSDDTLECERLAAVMSATRNRLHGKRLGHSFGVAETMLKLAHRFGFSPFNAVVAGWLHDWDKLYGDDAILKRGEDLGIVWNESAPYWPWVLHAETAAVAVKQEFDWISPEVLCAIARHTTGGINPTPFDKALYVADYTEPARPMEASAQIRALLDTASLEELYERVRASTVDYIQTADKPLSSGEPYALQSPSLQYYG